MTVVSVSAPGLYSSWRKVVWEPERWPHISPQELACKCGGKFCQGSYYHCPATLDGFELMRADQGRPLVFTSGTRCSGHNLAVGGAPMSQHLIRIAGDILLEGHDPVRLARSAQRHGFTGIGFGRGFLHVDRRPGRPVGFHYPGGASAWKTRFGFDPAGRVTAGKPL